MGEKRSKNKMNRIQEYKYHVVQLLENRFGNSERIIREYVCVPESLLQWCSPEDNIVRLWYPDKDPITTEDLVKNLVKRGKKSFLSVLVHSTDNYEEAKEYINKKNLENNINKDDITLSALVEGETSNSTSSGVNNGIENILDTLEWSVPSKSASTTTPKRRASTDSDKTAHRKRSRVEEPGNSVDEVTGTKSPAFNKQKGARKGSNKDNGRNIKDKKQPMNENPSNANQSLHPESVAQQILPIFAECLTLILKLQKCLGHSMVREMVTKIIHTYNSRDTIPSAPIATSEKTPELNEEERNEEQTEENDADGNICDDDDKSKMKQKSSEQLETFELPRTYDANDSRWTLKYRGPGPGLEELVENSGVYIRSSVFYDCGKSKTGFEFAKKLLSAIFTASALRTCSWAGKTPSGCCSQATTVRPGLDAHAREVLIDYVTSNTIRSENFDENRCRKRFKSCLYQYMLTLRQKYREHQIRQQYLKQLDIDRFNAYAVLGGFIKAKGSVSNRLIRLNV